MNTAVEIDVPVSIVLVDDQDDVRLLLRAMILAENHGLFVEDEADCGRRAVDLLLRCGASVVVLDQMMPDMSGLEAAREILKARPDQRIILFTAFLDDQLEAEARAMGIECIDKRDFGRLIGAIRAAAR